MIAAIFIILAGEMIAWLMGVWVGVRLGRLREREAIMRKRLEISRRETADGVWMDTEGDPKVGRV